jgi:hypothetical protein
MPRILAVTLLAASIAAAPGLAAAQDADDAALADLQRFLDDPAARNENAASDPNAAAVENLLRAYPSYAQQELLAIAQMIVQESGAGAQKHVDAYQQGGAAGAAASLSPAVRARISALETRLEHDPSFNTPENLDRMRGEIPGFLGQPPR